MLSFSNNGEEILPEYIVKDMQLIYKTHSISNSQTLETIKNFNDKYGHLIGDEVLKNVAQKLQSSIRDSDTLSRWGGEEFIIIFTETSSVESSISESLTASIEPSTSPFIIISSS